MIHHNDTELDEMLAAFVHYTESKGRVAADAADAAEGVDNPKTADWDIRTGLRSKKKTIGWR